MSKARDLANFGDDISDGVISAALDGDGSALTGLSSGPTEVVSSGTASNVASIDFTGLDLTTYDYKIVLRGVGSHSSYQNLFFAGSYDGLSSFYTGDYWYVDKSSNTNGADGSYASNVDYAELSAGFTCSASNPATLELDLSFHQLSASYTRNIIRWAYVGSSSSNGYMTQVLGSFTEKYHSSGSVLDSFQLYMSSANITAQNYTLYRTVKS